MHCKLSAILLLALVTLATADKATHEAASSAAPPPAATGGGLPSGPEGRQIGSKSDTSNLMAAYGGSSGSGLGAFPNYAQLYQNAVLGSGLPQTAASAGSWLSMLRPTQGGRRSSLTSRLRNIMNALFRREQSSPYLAQGSSLSYALRQPPLGFGAASLAGASGLAGLGASLGSGFGGFGSGSGGFGSGSGLSPSNAALLQAASQYQPLVMPSSGSLGGSGNSGNVASASNYWGTGSGVGSGSGSPSSGPSSFYGPTSGNGLGSFSGNSGNGVAGGYQASVPSPQSYQVAASSYNPSGSGSGTYSVGGGSVSQPNQYQRSSSSSFKPIVSNAFASSGLVASGSAPAASFAPAPQASQVVSSQKVSYSSQ